MSSKRGGGFCWFLLSGELKCYRGGEGKTLVETRRKKDRRAAGPTKSGKNGEVLEESRFMRMGGRKRKVVEEGCREKSSVEKTPREKAEGMSSLDWGAGALVGGTNAAFDGRIRKAERIWRRRLITIFRSFDVLKGKMVRTKGDVLQRGGKRPGENEWQVDLFG